MATYIAENVETVVESTAQQLADAIGVARSSVIRTCQSLGYKGYPQLRVALAREQAPNSTDADQLGSNPLDQVRRILQEFAQVTPSIASAIDEPTLERVLTRLVTARRIVCVANGFSSAVALDLSMRLSALGLAAQHVPDIIAQQITLAHLTDQDVCFIVSASGRNLPTLDAARFAVDAGATVIALCAFIDSPLSRIAHHTLIAFPATLTFRTELLETSRVAQVLLVEAIVHLVGQSLRHEPERRARLVPVLGANLVE